MPGLPTKDNRPGSGWFASALVVGVLLIAAGLGADVLLSGGEPGLGARQLAAAVNGAYILFIAMLVVTVGRRLPSGTATNDTRFPVVMLVVPAFAVLVFAIALRLDHFFGDSSVYLGFAKSAWIHGFFHYGVEGPKHGASSPLWAMCFMLVYPFSGSAMGGYQIVALCSVAYAASSTYRLGREIGSSRATGILAAGFLAANVSLVGPAVMGFGNALLAGLVADAVAATLRLLRDEGKSNLARWGVVMSLLPLARPEGGAFAVVLATLFLAHSVSRRGLHARLAVPFIAAIPSMAFYGWMWAATHRLLPASVVARAVDQYTGEASAWSLIRASFGLSPSGLLVLGAIAGWMLLLCRSRWSAAVVIATPATIFAAFLASNPGWSAPRYGSSLAGVGAALIAVGLMWPLERWPSPKRRGTATLLSLGLCAVLMTVAESTEIGFAREADPGTQDIVLDIDGAKRLNELVGDEARILVYEIQTQFYVRSQLISADGIVGGEILPYLARHSVEDFLFDTGITHIAVSSGYDYRPLFDGSILEELWGADQSTSVGEELLLRGVRMRKIAQRETTTAHWRAIYQVVGRQ